MKIALIIFSLDCGGAEKVLSSMANYWVENGHEVRLITFSSNNPFFKINSKITLIKIGLGQVYCGFVKGFYYNILRIFALRKILKNRPDIAISFITPTNIIATIAAKTLSIPIIISERSNKNRFPINNQWAILRRIIYPFANSLIVLSKYDKEHYGFLKNVEIIHNPINAPTNFKNVDKGNIILGVGRIDYLKGFDLLIKAFAKAHVEGWQLWIVGDGPLLEDLQALVENIGISSITKFIGKQVDIYYYYSLASIFVLSSRTEGFPNVLCEAMASGLACISYNCITGPSEIITDGVDGILVEPENIERLSDCIKEVINNPELRNRLSQNAVQIRQRLAMNAIINKWDKIAYSILKRKI
jgi:GalNAc-alpha-(1->4)-GalNAc-alpha-(1->3)-diNAcBac-PP-undecaprenol alpha-1,4-N-acetyl-D-galactosaminyltransferase